MAFNFKKYNDSLDKACDKLDILAKEYEDGLQSNTDLPEHQVQTLVSCYRSGYTRALLEFVGFMQQP